MTKDEIRKAADELKERVDGEKTEGESSNVVELLGKALDYIFKKEERVVKSEEDDTREEESLDKAEEEGAEEFYKGIVESDNGKNLEDALDVAPILETFTDQIAKAMGGYEAVRKAQKSQAEEMEAVKYALAALLKSHQSIFALMENIKDQPVSRTSPGFVLAPSGETRTEAPVDLRDRVLKAVQSGKLDPKYYAWFDTREPAAIYESLPEGALD